MHVLPSLAVSAQARGNFSSHKALSCLLGFSLKQTVFILQPNSKDLDRFSSRPPQLRVLRKEVDLSLHLGKQISPEQGIVAVRDDHEWVGYLSHVQVHNSLGSLWILFSPSGPLDPQFFAGNLPIILEEDQVLGPSIHQELVGFPSTFKVTLGSGWSPNSVLPTCWLPPELTPSPFGGTFPKAWGFPRPASVCWGSLRPSDTSPWSMVLVLFKGFSVSLWLEYLFSAFSKDCSQDFL